MMTNFTDVLRVSPMNLNFQQNITNTSGTEFFFINTAYLDAYIQLLDGIRQHRGLLVLTGEAGVGKTSLLRKLVNESPAKIKFVYCYTTNLDFDNLLAVIGDQLGLMTQEGEFSNRLEALKHCLDDYFTRGIDIAFLIDDAHHLNENALNGLLDLSPFEFEGKRTVQLVLSGTPVLEEILTQMQVFHTSLAGAVHVRLEPLRTEEVAAFISRQVQNADGPAVDSLFPLPVIARINNYTGGIPRLINMLCERALLLTQIKGQTTVSIATIDEAAGELILKEKEIAASPVTDFFSLETTQTGNAMQVARMEQLLAWNENLPNEETQTLVVGPLAMEHPEEYPSSTVQWDNRESGKKRSNLLNSTGLQIILLALLALLAGLFGGMGSVYWYQRTTAEVKPQLPASMPADMTTGGPAPIDKLESPATARLAPASSPTNSEISANPEASSSGKPLETSPTPTVVAETVPPAAPIESPSAAPSPTTVKSVEAPLVSSYLMNGNLWLERGDIASARLFYQEAANAGSVQALVAVGKTYDPVILNQLGIRGFRPDPVKAAEWYLKGNKAGDSESAERLNELRRWLSNSPALEESEANILRQLLR
jgi:type II secretory pathway predicted ATPase ExeA